MTLWVTARSVPASLKKLPAAKAAPAAGLRRCAVLLGTLAALAGCKAPPPPAGPTELVLHVPDRDLLVDSTASVLRRYDFAPAVVDRSLGLVVSEPATSAQWFELWRPDASGGYQRLESSLHTTRRVVTVEIESLDERGEPVLPGPSPATAPAGDGIGQRCRLRVRVDKSRLSTPERQITTASGAMGLYSRRVPTMQRMFDPSKGPPVQWVPLGRDERLEQFLLDKIMERGASKKTPVEARWTAAADQPAE